MVAFRGQPDHVDGIFGASADAVLLAATIGGPLKHSHPILCFETGGSTGGNAEAAVGAEFLDNCGKPFERVFLFHDFLNAVPQMKYRQAAS
jgi:hypothetical protein